MIITSTPRRSRRVLLCAAIALSGLGLTTISVPDVAHAGSSTAAPTTSATTTATTVTVADDTDWIAVGNAEQDALATYLAAHNIAYTIENDGESHWVVYDYADQAATDAVDDYYWALYPIPQGEIDASNVETDTFATFLRARGIEVTVTTDRHGYHDVEWNYDDPAAIEAEDDYYWEQYPFSADEIALMNQDTEAENAYLTAHGFAATITTDKHGIETDEYDYSDDAVYEALDTFYSTYAWAEAEG